MCRSILYLTTCVGLGYGPCMNSLEAFLGSIGSLNSPQRVRIKSQPYDRRIYLPIGLHSYTSTTTDWPSYLPASPHRLATTRSGPAHPHHATRRSSRQFWAVSITDSPWARTHGYGNINPLSIDYACRPRLRSRLTLGRLA